MLAVFVFVGVRPLAPSVTFLSYPATVFHKVLALTCLFPPLVLREEPSRPHDLSCASAPRSPSSPSTRRMAQALFDNEHPLEQYFERASIASTLFSFVLLTLPLLYLQRLMVPFTL